MINKILKFVKKMIKKIITPILKMYKKYPIIFGVILLSGLYYVFKNRQEGFQNIPEISGLIAQYTGDSFDGGDTWKDIVGSYDATKIGGPIQVEDGLNGNAIIKGGTAGGFKFPKSILPSVYTLFHLTRYSGAKKGRIVSSTNNNWLSGHGGGRSGVAYHQGWVGKNNNIHSSKWVLSTDQNNLYRSNNKKRGTLSGGKSGNLHVNKGMKYKEASDFEIAEIIVYNRKLTADEIKQVEGYLAHKYGLSFKGDYPDVDAEAKKAAAAAEEEEAKKAAAAAEEEAKKVEAAAEEEEAKKAAVAPEEEGDAEEAGPEADAGGICFPETAIVNNKPISEIPLPENCVVAAVTRNNETFMGSDELLLCPGDRLIIFMLGKTDKAKIQNLFMED